MVCPRRHIGPNNQGRAEKEILERFEQTMIDGVLPFAGEGIAGVEAPVHFLDVLSDDLDLFEITHSQPSFVSTSDKGKAKGIEAHNLRCHRVDGDLIGRSQDEVLDVNIHAAWSWPATDHRTVHDREEARVNLFLDHEQVGEGLVDHGMCPMTLLVQEAAEGILHRAGHAGEHVGLHGRKVDDILTDQTLGYVDPFWENLV